MDASQKEEKEIGAEAADKKKTERAEKRAAGEKMRNMLLCSVAQRKGAAATQRAVPSAADEANEIIESLSKGASLHPLLYLASPLLFPHRCWRRQGC